MRRNRRRKKKETMERNEQKPAGSTSRRSFIRKGVAVGGAGAIGAGLLATGIPAFAHQSNQSNGSITRGDAAILRFLAAAEILETDLWQQYNELVSCQVCECH